MDGAHDMGGVQGFGPVMPEPNEPIFHAAWERRAFAITLAMARPGGWNIDQSRFARENRPPADYLAKSYYEIWIAGLENLMIERDLVTSDEIDLEQVLHPPKPASVLAAQDVAAMLRRGGPTQRQARSVARFVTGDRVRTINVDTSGHTRLPRYVRGHIGIVTLNHGCHVFPDDNASASGEQPQWLYTVAFSARELWGPDADAGATISVDAWDSYLEPA